MLKKSNAALVLLLLFCLALQAQKNASLDAVLKNRLARSTTNLIPAEAGATPSYWCTWSAQNFAVDSQSLAHAIGLGDHRMLSDNLTQKRVFGNPGWEQYIPAEIKKDLFLVLDVGWDIPGGQQYDSTKWIIGTLAVATDKFPDMTGTPQERLVKLNALTKARGWKGAGLWIAAQTEMDSRKMPNITNADIESLLP
jgi:hypothetical protein